MSQNLFPIPLTVIQVESGMEIEIEEEIFTIKSSYIKIHSDMDVLELLFEKNVETEEKFVESERKIDCKRSS